MINYMLDTKICVDIIQGRSEHFRELLNSLGGRLCISSVTWGELVYAAESSSKPTHNLEQIEGFKARLAVKDYCLEASRQYGQIKAELALKNCGDLISVSEMMVAGHARSEGLILVTNDNREFEHIDGLRVEMWIKQNIDKRG
jgi:tRNA(fMet)-specific endonuclease VapC